MPRAVAVTKLDKERADFEETVAICQRVFGDGVMAIYLPLHGDDEALIGNLGLLSQQIHDYSSGTRVEHGAEAEHRDLIEGNRSELLEAIIQESEDDTLLDRYLGGEEIDVEVVTGDLTHGTNQVLTTSWGQSTTYANRDAWNAARRSSQRSTMTWATR